MQKYFSINLIPRYLLARPRERGEVRLSITKEFISSDKSRRELECNSCKISFTHLASFVNVAALLFGCAWKGGHARSLLSSRRNSQHHRPAVERGCFDKLQYRSHCCAIRAEVHCVGLFAVLRWSLICVGLHRPLTPGNSRLHRNFRVKELKDVLVSGIHEAVRESVKDRVGRG